MVSGNLFYEGVYALWRNGLVEIIIFSLIYVLVFAVQRNVGLFAGIGKNDQGEGKKKKLDKVKKIHSVIALVIAFIAILPSFYSPWGAYNIIPLISGALPQISLVMIGIICTMVILGLFGFKIVGSKGNPIKFIIFVGIIVFVIWVFIWSSGRYNLPYWFTREMLAMIIALLVFGVIVSYVMGPTNEKKKFEDIFKESMDNADMKKWKKVKTLSKLEDMFEKL